ncbi:uncharacterized protein PgNI_08461 [Pyricularia grisea]|uniref:Uncharacterized protein n=1 Tax=Pyricularia grisea TaxID=148305 RepID=A0A6P8AWV2_PYRGI|nr:uncharacterized protein PgNI_08461 [Pyricularia grisea]TLD06706.1 hypothetical protein PgNI_08461 [Pyricularia grisea]
MRFLNWVALSALLASQTKKVVASPGNRGAKSSPISSSISSPESLSDEEFEKFCCVYIVNLGKPDQREWPVLTGKEVWFEHKRKKYDVMALDRCNLVWGRRGEPKGVTFEFLETRTANKDGTC